jgi:creatinine amidohydrolase
VILPIGSFEQHGPHLPLGTDAIIADHLAGAVAERTSGTALPVIPYGAPSRPREGGGERFGAPNLELPTLLAAVESTCRGCVAAGARAIVVLSWHYENASVLWEAVRDALSSGAEARAVLFSAPWDLIDEALLGELTGGGPIDWRADHAGLLETAIMLEIAPELTGEAPAPVAFEQRPHYEVIPTPADAVPDTGVVNDARSVTAETGRRCIDAMVAGMSEATAAELS